MRSKTIRILLLCCAGILALKFGTATLLKALSYNNMGKNMSAPLSLAPEIPSPEVLPPAPAAVEPANAAPIIPVRWVSASAAPSAPSANRQTASRQSAEVFPEGEQLFQPAEASSFDQISSAQVRVRNEALPPIVSAGAGNGGQPPKNEAKPVEEDPVSPPDEPVVPPTDSTEPPPETDDTNQLPPHELPGLPGDEDNQLPTDRTPTAPPSNGGGGNTPPTNSVPDGGLTSALLALGVASLAIAKHRSNRK